MQKSKRMFVTQKKGQKCQTCIISYSLSWGRWQVTFSKAVICLSFNLFEYLWPSTILHTYMNHNSLACISIYQLPLQLKGLECILPPLANNLVSAGFRLVDMAIGCVEWWNHKFHKSTPQQISLYLFHLQENYKTIRSVREVSGHITM